MPSTLISADDITRGKPDPEPFLLAARRLGVDPADCVVFEDAPAGLAGGPRGRDADRGVDHNAPGGGAVADVVVPDLSAVSAQATDGGLEITTAD